MMAARKKWSDLRDALKKECFKDSNMGAKDGTLKKRPFWLTYKDD
jgi:hypothetical protein